MVVLLVAAAGVSGNFHDDAVGAGMASWSSGCPEGWISVDHLGCLYFRVDLVATTVIASCFHIYIFLFQSLSWAKAEAQCDSMGGFLAEPDTEAKAKTLVTLI